jgi:Arginine/serine-rich protein PNISR
MNQPDANYWLSLAAQWIQSKSQTQMNFPNYPYLQSQQMIAIPQAPEPPRISHNDATANDNLVEADMELEDDVKEPEITEELSQIWSDWQKKTDNSQQKQHLPIVQNNQTPRFPAAAKHHTSRTESRFTNVQIPHAPIIGQINESSRSSYHGGDSNSNHHVDMVLDSEEEDETSSAILEAQKRKKLPLWIREGLERIEREKKQEILRIEREKEMQEDEENRKKIMEEAIKELETEKKFSKSKYVRKVNEGFKGKCSLSISFQDSDSENDEQVERDETPETELPPTVQDEEDSYEKMVISLQYPRVTSNNIFTSSPKDASRSKDADGNSTRSY